MSDLPPDARPVPPPDPDHEQTQAMPAQQHPSPDVAAPPPARERLRDRLWSLRAVIAVALASAYLGGHLVYRKQIGVNHAIGNTPPEDWTPVLDDNELADGEPRLVDVGGETYEVARRYMIRLEKGDFEDAAKLEKLAAVVKMTAAQFTERFGYVVQQ